MFKTIQYFLTITITIIAFNLININPTWADNLEKRINNFPQWDSQISLPSPEQELIYPRWFQGTWEVTNILKEQIAPLAPKFQTPGFSQNATYIDQKIVFPVKFISATINQNQDNFFPNKINDKIVTIADRAFNGRAIARAYLGEENVQNVMVNSNNSTEQITKFSQDNKLISTVIGRETESINEQEFITSEITRQFFRRPGNVYINFVETTTKYTLIDSNHIQAQQYTAVYLSPQDPDYFLAFNQPVALYSYELNLEKKEL
ncbi:hypothetical protein Cyast_1742 [Cyanobacterium stanieri PCC 7202]|uniref:DUF6816 domain-containing protein n=1 Tax=Cyanobacterium stanieri (strain ATCC 29140 / PCC 7202) TaxID=292563 RepID=K9YNQ0_CYASC|nr:hypothetical protein Cyast_1742 [Cyanobacterium stanieri PCC 7202]